MVVHPERRCLPIEVEPISLHRDHRPRPERRRWLSAWWSRAVAFVTARRAVPLLEESQQPQVSQVNMGKLPHSERTSVQPGRST